MQFTPDEEKMIEWLRRQHAGWPAVRAITLSGGMVGGVAGMWELSTVGFNAMAFVFLLIAAMCSSYTLGSWSGRAEVSLLLKLVEAAREPK